MFIVILQEIKDMEARLDCEFGKESDHEGSWVMTSLPYYHGYYIDCPLDDDIDDSEASSDLFCVACNKLFRTTKA